MKKAHFTLEFDVETMGDLLLGKTLEFSVSESVSIFVFLKQNGNGDKK